MIKKVIVGTEPTKISEGKNPKTLIVYNNSLATIYLTSDPTQQTGEGIPVLAGGSYTNIYAKGNYYLIAGSASLDVRVEEN